MMNEKLDVDVTDRFVKKCDEITEKSAEEYEYFVNYPQIACHILQMSLYTMPYFFYNEPAKGRNTEKICRMHMTSEQVQTDNHDERSMDIHSRTSKCGCG